MRIIITPTLRNKITNFKVKFNDLKSKLSKYRVVLYPLCLITALLFVIAFFLDENLWRDLLINLVASGILLFFTIVFIDDFYERKKEEKWEGIRSIVMLEVDSLIGKTVSTYIVFYNLADPLSSEFDLDSFKSTQSEKFVKHVLPKLDIKDNYPPIFHYNNLNESMSKIQTELTLLIVTYIELMPPKVTEALITLRDFIIMLNNELEELDYIDPSKNSHIKFDILNHFLSFTASSLQSVSANMILHSKVPKDNLYKLS